MKMILTLTDRPHRHGLDLRKKRLGDLNTVSIFKVNEDGEMVSYQEAATYYPPHMFSNFFRHIETNRFTLNTERRSFLNQPVTKEEFNKFLKFAKKYGKVVEWTDQNPGLLAYNELQELRNEILTAHKEFRALLSNFKEIEIRKKNGNYKKISYRNILITGTPFTGTSNRFYYLTDTTCCITHAIKGLGIDQSVKLVEHVVNFFSFWNFHKPESIKVYQLTKKQREDFLGFLQEFTNLEEKYARGMKKVIDKLFDQTVGALN